MLNRTNQLGVYWLLKAALLYVGATLFLYIFGPWEYVGESVLLVVAFMVIAMSAFALGYRSVARLYRTGVPIDQVKSDRNVQKYRLLASAGLVAQLLLLLMSFYSDYSAGNFSFAAILNPGQIYADAIEAARLGVETSVIGQLRVLFAPLFLFSNVYLALNFSRVSKAWRYTLCATLLLHLAHGALTKGAQKGFFDLFILVAAVGFVRGYFNRDVFKRHSRKAGVALILIVAIFVFFQVSRFSAVGALDYTGTDEMLLDRDSLLFVIFGDSVGLGLTLFGVYLTHGYFGLSLCLQLPFEWTYGLGNSFALAAYAEQYLGISGIHEAAYPYRMEAEFGRPAKMYWQTFFPWIASDVTFTGTIPLMYLIGKCLARSMVDALSKNSALGMCVFYFMVTLLLYLPANNQLLQTREMTISFLILVVLWILSKLRFRASSDLRGVS